MSVTSIAKPMPAPQTLVIRGAVKWFDIGRGFGFIMPDDGGADILLHANVLRQFGQLSVAENARITVRVQPTARGYQATEVLDLSPPPGASDTRLDDLDGLDPGALQELPLQPARVKWYDKNKGFGFANLFGCNEDVFLHVEVLRRSGLSDLLVGEALALRVTEGSRGPIAVQVVAWDRVNPVSSTVET